MKASFLSSALLAFAMAGCAVGVGETETGAPGQEVSEAPSITHGESTESGGVATIKVEQAVVEGSPSEDNGEANDPYPHPWARVRSAPLTPEPEPGSQPEDSPKK